MNSSASGAAGYRVARIDESRCIGCTKCLEVCPTDAIVGAMNLMHTVIRAECIGCELCLPPCPVDCIEMESTPRKLFDDAVARERVKARKQRLARQKREEVADRERQKTYDPVAAAVLRARARAKDRS